jgi:predicted nucleic acid-binding protein
MSRNGAGLAKTSTIVSALVDTNVLVYVYDPRSPAKQRRAQQILLDGLKADSVRLPHQALVEFVAAVTRPTASGTPLMPAAEARREAEELLSVFGVLYPNDSVVRTALRGAAMYELSWFDAHVWAYAEVYGLAELWSEDFQHDRRYGTVRAVNPFV